ncbi:MAG: HPP family protein [Hyphomicrobiaceae bacterium]
MRRQFLIALYRALGASIAIGVMETLAIFAGEPMVRVPFVTSIVLAMALPDSEPAQPRSIIGGHMMSSLAGFAALHIVGAGPTASALAVGLATLAMVASRTLHPPAGIDAFLVASYSFPLQWIIEPVLIGALLLTGFALAWRTLEKRLFMPGERRAAPQLWSMERIRALTRPWRARP